MSRIQEFDRRAESITHDRAADYGDPGISFRRIALMWSANPALIGNIAGTEAILRHTARPFSGSMASLWENLLSEQDDAGDIAESLDQILAESGGCLAEIGAAETPNDLVGYGIVDAYAAVRAAMEMRP